MAVTRGASGESIRRHNVDSERRLAAKEMIQGFVGDCRDAREMIDQSYLDFGLQKHSACRTIDA